MWRMNVRGDGPTSVRISWGRSLRDFGGDGKWAASLQFCPDDSDALGLGGGGRDVERAHDVVVGLAHHHEQPGSVGFEEGATPGVDHAGGFGGGEAALF